VNTFTNYNESESFGVIGDGGTSRNIGKVAQFSSTANYQTGSGKMDLNGSIRLIRQRTESRSLDNTGLSSERRTTRSVGNVRLGFRYRVSRNLRASGSTDASRNFETIDPSPSYGQRLSLGYSGDPLEIGKFSYSWNSSAGVANTIIGDGETTTTTGGLGHSIRRPLYKDKKTRVGFNFGQSYSVTKTIRTIPGADARSDQTLANNVSIGASTKAKKRQLHVRLSGSDYRSGSALENLSQSNSQVVNFLVTLNWRLTTVSSLSGSYTTQYATRQEASRPVETSVASSGSLVYQNSWLFDIRGLSFISTVRVSDEQGIISFGDEKQNERFSWDNRLEFIAGRLRGSATVRWEEIDGVGRGVAIIRIAREFGGRR
jgi:hypothetical protein